MTNMSLPLALLSPLPVAALAPHKKAYHYVTFS